MNIELGTKIYYTGDMANPSGWFKVVASGTGHYTLQETDGDRTFRGIHKFQIGDVYQGHCNPRFVTETAVTTYRNRHG